MDKNKEQKQNRNCRTKKWSNEENKCIFWKEGVCINKNVEKPWKEC